MTLKEGEALRTCCILQPTFLPWLGWFDLVDRADVCVLLDDVPFSKQSWQQRNRIRTSRGLEFVSVPVKSAGRLGQLIQDVEIADSASIAAIMGKIREHYRKAPYYSALESGFQDAFDSGFSSGRLASLNVSLIKWMLRELAISTPVAISSEIGIGGKRGEKVAQLCVATGSNSYLSPAGSEDYLVEDAAYFKREHIAVSLQAYEHPQYLQQVQPFMAFASTLDLLFNVGSGALDVIRSGHRQDRPLGVGKD